MSKHLRTLALVAAILLSGCAKTTCPTYMTEKEVMEAGAKSRAREAKRNKNKKKRSDGGKLYRTR
jgi:outer membrane biogenesis lipoprotein LolB